MQPVIKWSGSKRHIATQICSYIDFNYNCYYEPFIGGGSILYTLNPTKAVCSDILPELIDLWILIRDNPQSLLDSYTEKWNQFKNDKQFYYNIREQFNKYRKPDDFFFLLRTCANGLVRFNSKDEFNVAVHHNRNGITPGNLEKILSDWSSKISSYQFLCRDYTNILDDVLPGDLVYLDPPYFHTKTMYSNNISKEDLFNLLEQLNSKDVKWLLNLDGTNGDTSFVVDVPKDLYKEHILIENGICGFHKLKNVNSKIAESLYKNF